MMYVWLYAASAVLEWGGLIIYTLLINYVIEYNANGHWAI